MMVKRGKKFVSYVSVFEIFLMIGMSFALAFFMQESFVSANNAPVLGPPSPPLTNTPTGTSAFNNGLEKTSGVSGGATGSFPDGAKILTGPAGSPGITLNDPSKLGLEGVNGNPQVYAVQNMPDKTVQLLDQNGKQIGTNTVPVDKVPALNSELAAKGITETPKEDFSVMGVHIASAGLGTLLEGLSYAGLAVGAIQLIGGLFGLNKGTTSALSMAAFAGIMTYKGLQSLGPRGFDLFGGQTAWVTRNADLIGLGVAVLVFVLLYKNTNTKTVTFTCLPYEPPLGGAHCEDCNKDPFRPCSEYRCRALGQACQLLNANDAAKAMCAWVNPKDVTSPTITPWVAALYPTGLKYISDTSVRPPALGVKIQTGNGGCLPAFAKLQFGITTNEPAQCKIDYNHTAKMDDMTYYFGEDNAYIYNHTQIMRLPAPDSNTSLSGSPLLNNGGTFSLYARCRDANGNENADEYAISFCVDKSPDTTPPVIENTSIPSGSPVQFGTDSVPIQVFVNEPADCKWSTKDKSYNDMENNMTCNLNSYRSNSDLLFVCNGNLTGVVDNQNNNYYFRCKDQPGKADKDRNTMSQSFPLLLRGSQPLNIDNAGPNGTISGSTLNVPVDLTVQTSSGSDQGKAVCYFSNSQNLNSFVSMFETNSFQHKQTLQLVTGSYQYFFRCVDAGGNVANASTTFSVFVDKQAPMVTRIYKDSDALKVVTDEDAQCVYSLTTCNYNLADGIKMVYNPADNKRQSFAEWKPNSVYYIKCQDSYGNEPNPSECSVIGSAIEPGT